MNKALFKINDNSIFLHYKNYRVFIKYEENLEENIKQIEKQIYALSLTLKENILFPDISIFKSFHFYIKFLYKNIFDSYQHITQDTNFLKTYTNNLIYFENRLKISTSKTEIKYYIEKIKNLNYLYILYKEFNLIYLSSIK